MLQMVSRTALHSSAKYPAPSLLSTITSRTFHSEYNSSLEEQTCVLPDGRKLGFAEYGSRSPDAVPAFFFHGAPGARYDGLGYHDSGKKLNVRIICPDRPGHGLSTHHPTRKLIDYPKDISLLAKHLKLTKYHVFGQSGGGPFALACAYGTPKDELLNATIVAGMGPPECATRDKAGLYTVIALWFHAKTPGLLKRFLNWYYNPAFINNDERLQKALNRFYKFLPKEEEEMIADPEAQPAIRALVRAAFAQGADGVIRDGQIYGSKDLWGFDLKDVQTHVQLIFGGKDTRTPLAFAQYYKEHLPDAELLEFPDAGHITIGNHVVEILAKAVGKEPPVEKDDDVSERPKEGQGLSSP